jgi:hypothetical protein
MVVDRYSGDAVSYSARVRSANTVDPARVLIAVAFPTTTICLAVDKAGNVLLLRRHLVGARPDRPFR